ncbi:MAG: Gfo/Idh/MocA family oxidoreductase [Clostridiales bacterium]|nr:Gfo/Idh/MocA family oxidoreductase [Clostridiales bacterium]
MKVGILGLGRMARGMGWTVQHLPEAEPWACASRSLEKAVAFQQEYSFRHAYDSYEKLYDDPDVELIYIATPNHLHYEEAKAALLHGKHVLCEKPLTVHYWEAEELVALARERQLFLMEAQMLRFMPLTATLQRVLREGVIGQPISFVANFFYPLEHVERVMRPEMGGGALLDIGVYPLTLADLILQSPLIRVTSDTVLTNTGVDAVDHILLRAENQTTAALTISIRGSGYRDGVINGTEGYLILRDVNHLNRIERYDSAGRWQQSWDKPEQISDYAHELSATIRAIRAGQTQCSEYPWETMLAQMRLIDGLRKQWGVVSN